MEMQQAAEDTIAATLTEPEDPQAALVSMTPNGAIKAFVGGRDFDNVKKARGFNYVSDNYRQAGSSYKPFTLLAAIENGVSLQSSFSGASPYTVDDPQCSTNGELWEPSNYGFSSYGYMDLVSATAIIGEHDLRAAHRRDRSPKRRRSARRSLVSMGIRARVASSRRHRTARSSSARRT